MPASGREATSASASFTTSANRRTPEGFALTGPSVALEPRTHAIRKDIADIALAGRWIASHYARPMPRAVRVSHAAVRVAGNAEARAESQLLHGEGFAVIEISGGFAWGYCAHDHYVGYVEADALGDPIEPTHFVTARSTLLFAGADIKAPVLAALPMGARLSGTENGDFLATDEGLVHRSHLMPVGEAAGDPVELAERLIGAPYRWGGRGGDGIDCSGLVQLAFGLAGVPLPRDSDMQRDQVGETLGHGEALRRGDLVFFKDHVGILADAGTLIHANSHWMAVTAEPLEQVKARLGEPLLARRVAA